MKRAKETEKRTDNLKVLEEVENCILKVSFVHRTSFLITFSVGCSHSQLIYLSVPTAGDFIIPVAWSRYQFPNVCHHSPDNCWEATVCCVEREVGVSGVATGATVINDYMINMIRFQ